MSLEVFGDGGDGEDLSEAAEEYGYSVREDGTWWNYFEDEGGDTMKTDEEMWAYVWDRRSGDD